MDFLDPKRKKAHRRRLFVGYILMALTVAIGTLILLFSAYGFWVDRRTGDVIQNGTVFLDSQPAGSNIYLDGKLTNSRTATRLVLPGSRQYNIKLTQNGYRDWQRVFSLDGGKIERLLYPMLIPEQLKPTELQLYATAPSLVSQSLDRRWLLVQHPDQAYSFDLYDLNNYSRSPVEITLPAAALSEPTDQGSISVVEWSSDNRHALLDRIVADKHEYIILDVQNPAASLNINNTLALQPSQIRLRDRKADQVTILETGGVLRFGDLKAKNITGAVLSNVIDYKTYGTNLILYATKEAAPGGKTSIRIREDDKKTYLLKNVLESPKYLLDVSVYRGDFYYVFGGSLDEAVLVYKNPLSALKSQSNLPLIISSVMRLSGANQVSFSAGSQFIALHAGSKILTYDLDGDRQYTFDPGHSLSSEQQVSWVDNNRLTFTDKGYSYMFDFDGSNNNQMLAAQAGGLIFSQDYRQIFSIAPSTKANGRFALTQAGLIIKQ